MLATTLCIYFACSESGKDEAAPVTPNTETPLDAIPLDGSVSGDVTLRANCGGSLVCPCTCCCGLTLISPTGTDIDVNICGPAVGCFSGSGSCGYGASIACSVNTGTGNGGTTMLNTSSGSGDTKIFCSGGANGTDFIQIQNVDAQQTTATFVIECGGSSSNQFTLQYLERAFIRKGTNCNIDPVDPCID